MTEPPPAGRRRPTIDEVFGDVFPDITSDERDPEPPDPAADDWYEHNRPPHHEDR